MKCSLSPSEYQETHLLRQVVVFLAFISVVVHGFTFPVSSSSSSRASLSTSLSIASYPFDANSHKKGRSNVGMTTLFRSRWKRNAGNSPVSSTAPTILYTATVNGQGWLEVEDASVVGGKDEARVDASSIRGELARRDELKREMLQLGASYDRGFGATSRGRDEAEQVIAKLEALNPEEDAALGIDGDDDDDRTGGGGPSPLTGNWRMVWTTAADVLILGANPLVTVGAIYQIFAPPVVTNVIDLLPRFQALLAASSGLLPGGMMGSLLRAKVQTRASSRPGRPMRVGLVFESVRLEPVELLGNDVAFLPPLAFDLPRLPSLLVDSVASGIGASDGPGGSAGADAVGFFDVTYLDSDLLIIRQNAPGGLFVLARVENADP